MLSVRDLRRPGLGPLSFELAAGECLVLRGPSGAGKTLLLRALADLDPSEGEVRLEGALRESVPAPAWRRRVAYLPAETGWWGERVGEHFPEPVPARPLIEALGLPAESLDWPVARLSTGERQRLGLVRVLLLDPPVYLLDEPTGPLDEAAAATVEQVVKARLEAGAAALWVSHDTVQVARLADRQLMIEAGRLREAGP